MSNIERILVVVDAEEDFSASPDGLPIELRKALRLVKDKASVELRLLSIGYERYLHHNYKSIGSDYMAMRTEYVGRMEKSLNSVADKLTAQGINVSTEVLWAHPRYEKIVDKANEFNADLVVQHVRAHAKIEHYHLTNDSWQLVRYCDRPLLLVKDMDWTDPVVLMAAVDPMHAHHKPLQLDSKIIEMAQDVGALTGGEVHVVHAYGESAGPFESADKIKEEHSQAFDALVGKFNVDVGNIHFIDESPVFALREYAEKIHSNVIVMGATSRSRLTEALIGSTAEQTLDYIKTDVLIITPQK